MMESTSQKQLFQAITVHNPEGAARALAQGASWTCDNEGQPTTWEYGQPKPGVWRYNAAMMALSKSLTHGRMSILDLVPEGAVDWNKIVGAVIEPQSVPDMVGGRASSQVMCFVFDHWNADKLGRWQDIATRTGGTLLHAVAQEASFNGGDKIRDLLERGMDINAQDSRGRRPLHVVNHQAVARALLEAKADPLALDGQRQTPARAIVERIRSQARKNPARGMGSEDFAILWRLLEASPIEHDPKARLLARHLESLLRLGDDRWRSVGQGAKTAIERHMAIYQAYERRGALTAVAQGKTTRDPGRRSPRM